MSPEIKSDVTTGSESTSDLEKAIQYYGTKLDQLDSSETSETTVSETSIYEVLLARDAVENLLPKRFEGAEPSLAELVKLDQRLKAHKDLIGRTPNLKNWRDVLNPPETAWWWYFAPTHVVYAWNRLDWLWKTLAIGCLTMVGSLIFNATKAMSAGGAIQWPETFLTLLQGTGLALVAGGTVTSKGQNEIKKLLESLKIPRKFWAEATLIMAFILLLISGSIYIALPKYLLYSGTQNYDQGKLPKALIRLTQASTLKPDHAETTIALGKVYESLNDNSKARAQYLKIIPKGLPEGFNALGRVMIPQDPKQAETILRLGLQRAFISQQLKRFGTQDYAEIRYEFKTNLGWALLQQKRYEEARQELQKAVELDEKFPDKQFGTGMAQCFLIKTNLALGNEAEAIENWSACRSQARPEFLSEYQWIVDNGFSQLADCLDTHAIVVGLEGVNIPELLNGIEDCQKPSEFFPKPN